MENKWIHQLFVAPTNNWLLQLFRYGFVGGVAFVVDYGSLFLLTHYAGVPYLWSAAIAFILGLVTNYLLSISWVFRRNENLRPWVEFLFFAIIGVIGLVMNELIMYAGTDLLHMHYMVSKLISTAIVFFWNFFARKFLVFTQY
jgi:putative flippase GtrA